VQDAETLLAVPQRFATINRIMADVLDTFAALLILRRATPADLATLQHWDEQPHVLAADPDDDWGWETELAREPAWREQLIADVAGRSIGFVQIIAPDLEESHYWGVIAPGYRALDIWIGAADDLGKGYGTRMMELALARCFADAEVKAVLIDPLATNTRAMQFYETFDFEFVERRQFGPSDCKVYQLKREQHTLAS
jgi:aminoglycoside 6'-N-acetyltransferase